MAMTDRCRLTVTIAVCDLECLPRVGIGGQLYEQLVVECGCVHCARPPRSSPRTAGLEARSNFIDIFFYVVTLTVNIENNILA